MVNSPGIDRWISDKPTSWCKKVPAGQTTLEDFKDAFAKKMDEIGKKYVLEYLSEDQFQFLFEHYLGKEAVRASPELKKSIEQKIKEGLSKSQALESVVDKEVVGRKISVKGYSRLGRSIKGYASTHINWSEAQKRWLLSRATRTDNKNMAAEFNDRFSTTRSANSIRDKKLRLTGVKK